MKKDLKSICAQPRLVAVGKTQPKERIIEAYVAGQRHFGENYVQELIDKGNDEQITTQCPEIKWHMIGHLQTNKVNKVTSLSNLYMVETVDTVKLATALENSWAKKKKDNKLNVFVQINTSGEENKSGANPEEAENLVGHVMNKCPNLNFVGLMTIGIYDFDPSTGPNPDFLKLIQCRAQICDAFSLEPNAVELSMGMSKDYEHAIEVGATNVRVGSTIFGARNYKK